MEQFSRDGLHVNGVQKKGRSTCLWPVSRKLLESKGNEMVGCNLLPWHIIEVAILRRTKRKKEKKTGVAYKIATGIF